MDYESEGKDRDHYCYNREGHEFASHCEQPVFSTEIPVQRVDYRQEVYRQVEKKEDDQEKSAYAHYELLAD